MSHAERLLEMYGTKGPSKKLLCCKMGCSNTAVFWVGKQEADAVHACSDHVYDLKGIGDTVHRLEEPKVFEVTDEMIEHAKATTVIAAPE